MTAPPYTLHIGIIHPHHRGSDQLQNIHQMELPLFGDGYGQPGTASGCSPPPLSVHLHCCHCTTTEDIKSAKGFKVKQLICKLADH